MKTKKRLKLRKEVKVAMIFIAEILLYILASNNILGINATITAWFLMIVLPSLGVSYVKNN